MAETKVKVKIEESVPVEYATAQRELIARFERHLGRWGWIVLACGIVAFLVAMVLCTDPAITQESSLFFFAGILGIFLPGAGIGILLARRDLRAMREKFDEEHEEVER